MGLRTFLAAVLACGLAGAPLADGASSAGKVYRVGLLRAETNVGSAPGAEALRQGLRDLGYVEGRNLAFEYRYADDKYERLTSLAAELAQLNVDVIVTSGTPGALAVKRATATIPVVVAIIGDPVAAGVVESYARPGGNITGLSFHFPALMAKRIEILKEAVPGLGRVAVLRNPKNQSAALALPQMEQMARAMKVELHSLDVGQPAELDKAFAEMVRRPTQGVVVVDDPMLIAHSRSIAELAAKQRIATIGNRLFVEAGGLFSYGADVIAVFRQSAALVDKILKGAKPADLPIQQVERLELAVNRKTAKALDLTLPSSLLLRADKIID